MPGLEPCLNFIDDIMRGSVFFMSCARSHLNGGPAGALQDAPVSMRPVVPTPSGSATNEIGTLAYPATYPSPGEVIWCDDTGVTCRRWNWRQGIRTRLGVEVQQMRFILESLPQMPLEMSAIQTPFQILPTQGQMFAPDEWNKSRILSEITAIITS